MPIQLVRKEAATAYIGAVLPHLEGPSIAESYETLCNPFSKKEFPVPLPEGPSTNYKVSTKSQSYDSSSYGIPKYLVRYFGPLGSLERRYPRTQRALYGWLSKLGSPFGSPKYRVPCSTKDPKRDHQFHNHLYHVLRIFASIPKGAQSHGNEAQKAIISNDPWFCVC